MDNITKLVGTRIRGFRKEKRLSQEELAEKCSLHPTYIGQLERGEKNPTIESVMKIANGLEYPSISFLSTSPVPAQRLWTIFRTVSCIS